MSESFHFEKEITVGEEQQVWTVNELTARQDQAIFAVLEKSGSEDFWNTILANISGTMLKLGMGLITSVCRLLGHGALVEIMSIILVWKDDPVYRPDRVTNETMEAFGDFTNKEVLEVFRAFFSKNESFWKDIQKYLNRVEEIQETEVEKMSQEESGQTG